LWGFEGDVTEENQERTEGKRQEQRVEDKERQECEGEEKNGGSLCCRKGRGMRAHETLYTVQTDEDRGGKRPRTVLSGRSGRYA